MGGRISVEIGTTYGLLVLPPQPFLAQTKEKLHNAAFLCTVRTSLHVN